jgi:hypothetical protein
MEGGFLILKSRLDDIDLLLLHTIERATILQEPHKGKMIRVLTRSHMRETRHVNQIEHLRKQ